jgi:hypothetical protein
MLCNGAAAGCIYKRTAAGPDRNWFWGLAYAHFENRVPIYGYAETREKAMRAFAKSRRRE